MEKSLYRRSCILLGWGMAAKIAALSVRRDEIVSWCPSVCAADSLEVRSWVKFRSGLMCHRVRQCHLSPFRHQKLWWWGLCGVCGQRILLYDHCLILLVPLCSVHVHWLVDTVKRLSGVGGGICWGGKNVGVGGVAIRLLAVRKHDQSYGDNSHIAISRWNRNITKRQTW